ncbi:hypothetical protein V1478_013607 [Vespula squamosa]|uniref:Uncharacterized protein n=1 Tax=Vespula squamosa TaxID=30214 RepID=A0ABD2A5R5_VESSQ
MTVLSLLHYGNGIVLVSKAQITIYAYGIRITFHPIDKNEDSLKFAYLGGFINHVTQSTNYRLPFMLRT